MRNVRGSEKTNFNMAQGSDYQLNACKTFFLENYQFEQFKDEVTVASVKLEEPVYNITKFDAHKVVALLSQIVNNRGQFVDDNAFYFLIRKGEENKQLFRLTANPSKDHPGNGSVSRLLSWEGSYFRAATHSYLNSALRGHYRKDTKSFASDMKKLFLNNEVVNEKDFPQVTIEAYMILLFEIARRSVTSVENPSEKKKQLDDLPIGSAIAGLLKLLELGSEDICTFDDVFSRKDRFYCFAGEPEERRKAINRMNETLHLQELSKMFCAEEQPVDVATEEFERKLTFNN